MEVPVEKLIEVLPRKIIGGVCFAGILYYAAKDLSSGWEKIMAMICITAIGIWSIYTHYQLELKNPTPPQENTNGKM